LPVALSATLPRWHVSGQKPDVGLAHSCVAKRTQPTTPRTLKGQVVSGGRGDEKMEANGWDGEYERQRAGRENERAAEAARVGARARDGRGGFVLGGAEYLAAMNAPPCAGPHTHQAEAKHAESSRLRDRRHDHHVPRSHPFPRGMRKRSSGQGNG